MTRDTEGAECGIRQNNGQAYGVCFNKSGQEVLQNEKERRDIYGRKGIPWRNSGRGGCLPYPEGRIQAGKQGDGKNVMKRFQTAFYIRLSREDGDREESDSIANQRKLLKEYIAGKEEFILYDIYIDDGFTGTDFQRPGFRRMMEDIEKNRIGCVIVKDLSRFGRDYIDTGRYLERIFPKQGVRFISVSDHIDSAAGAYDMLLPIKNLFNEQYARDISAKIHATVRAKQKAGEFIGAFASYGYRKSPEDKNRLVIDEYAAGIVRRIFRMFSEGYAKQEIASVLNGEGILCPAEYKRVKGENYKNGNCRGREVYWTYSTIHSILRKEIYTGSMVQGTKRQDMQNGQKSIPRKEWTVVPGTHEPVIEREWWEEVQTLLEKRSRKEENKENDREEGKKERNLFAGFLRCADCGRAMVKNTWRHADGSRETVYYCGTYKRCGRQFCTPHRLPKKILEETIGKDMKALLENTDGEERMLEEIRKQREREKRSRKKSGYRDAETELSRVLKRKRELYGDYKEGLLTREEYCLYKEEYAEKEMLFRQQAREAGKRAEVEKAKEERFKKWINALKKEEGVENMERGMLAEMIEEITVFEDRRFRIRYRFSGNAALHGESGSGFPQTIRAARRG